jgi:hypothetical protein
MSGVVENCHEHCVHHEIDVLCGPELQHLLHVSCWIADMQFQVQIGGENSERLFQRCIRACDLSLSGGQISRVDASLQKMLKGTVASFPTLSGFLELCVGQPSNEIVLAGRHCPLREKDRHAIFCDLNKQAQEVAAQTASSDKVARMVVELTSGFPVGSEVCNLQWATTERRDDLVAEGDATDGAEARIK